LEIPQKIAVSRTVLQSNQDQFSIMKKPTVTLISGLPGSGKTSLLNHLLRNRGEKSMGVILNSLNETDDDDEHEPVDHEQIAEQSGESFVELTDGCICCSLREELLADVWQLSQQGIHDSLLIEASGVAEPTSVAEVFLYVDENGDSLADVATLDTLVTVVNAETFLNDYNSTDELCDLGIGLDEDDNRDLVRLAGRSDRIRECRCVEQIRPCLS
jgi:G3E family GTPase